MTTLPMDTTTAAGRLQALANPARLRIYEILSQAGEAGLTVGSVQDLVGINASTLSHHLKMLVLAGLVTQTRAATSLVCRPNQATMDGLFSYLARECRPAPKPQGRLTRQADLVTPRMGNICRLPCRARSTAGQKMHNIVRDLGRWRRFTAFAERERIAQRYPSLRYVQIFISPAAERRATSQ